MFIAKDILDFMIDSVVSIVLILIIVAILLG